MRIADCRLEITACRLPIGDCLVRYRRLKHAVIYVGLAVICALMLLPIAFVFFVGCVGKGISDIYRFDLHITTSSVLLTMTAIQIAAIALIADLIVRRTR